MRRRRVLALAPFVLAAIGIGVACTFPDVTFAPDGLLAGDAQPSARDGGDASPATTGDATPGPTDGGGGGGDGAIVFVEPPADAGDAGPVTRDDASAPIVDAGVCSSHTQCDCDEDGYAAKDCPVADVTTISSKITGRRLMPGDCDDRDPLRHPDQGFVTEKPVGHAGDWDCSGTVETDTSSNPSQWCKGNPITGPACNGTGFTDNVACGEQALVYVCGASGLSCAPTEASPRQMKPRACK